MQGSYNQVPVMLELVYLSPQLFLEVSLNICELLAMYYLMLFTVHLQKKSKNTLHIKQKLLHMLRCKSYLVFKQKLMKWSTWG